jgi:hypothetical protein
MSDFVIERLPQASSAQQDGFTIESLPNNAGYVPKGTGEMRSYNWGPVGEAEQYVAEKTGLRPETVRNYDPIRAAAGAGYGAVIKPVSGLAQLGSRAAAYTASGFGYTPNRVSDYLYDEAAKADETTNILKSKADVFSGAAERTSAPNVPEFVGEAFSPIYWGAGRGTANVVNRLIPQKMVPTPQGEVQAGANAAIRGTVRGAATGAEIGASQPVYTNELTKGLGEGEEPFYSQKAKNIGVGAVTGPLSEAAGNVIGGIVGPAISQDVRYLHEKGISTTAGQTLGPSAASIERNVFGNMPFAGHKVDERKLANISEMNRVALAEPLKTIGQNMPEHVPPGFGGYEHVRDAVVKELGDTYSSIRFRPGSPTNSTLMNDLRNIVSEATAKLPPQNADNVARTLNNTVMDLFNKAAAKPGRNAGVVAPDELRDLMSSLKTEALELGASGHSVYEKRQGFYIRQAVNAIDDRIARQHGQAVSDRLATANKAYAQLSVLRDAVTSPDSVHGVFSPNTLQRVAISHDPSDGHLAAEGRAFFQELSNAAKNVLDMPSRHGGATERFVGLGSMGVGATMAAGHAFGPAGVAAVMAPIAGTSLAYSQGGQNLLNKLIAGGASVREPLGNKIRQYGPEIGTRLYMASGAPISTNLMDAWQQGGQ